MKVITWGLACAALSVSAVCGTMVISASDRARIVDRDDVDPCVVLGMDRVGPDRLFALSRLKTTWRRTAEFGQWFDAAVLGRDWLVASDVFAAAPPLAVKVRPSDQLVWRETGERLFVIHQSGYWSSDLRGRRFVGATGLTSAMRCDEFIAIKFDVILASPLLPVCVLDDRGNIGLETVKGDVAWTGASVAPFRQNFTDIKVHVSADGKALGVSGSRSNGSVVFSSIDGKSTIPMPREAAERAFWLSMPDMTPVLVSEGFAAQQPARVALAPDGQGGWIAIDRIMIGDEQRFQVRIDRSGRRILNGKRDEFPESGEGGSERVSRWVVDAFEDPGGAVFHVIDEAGGRYVRTGQTVATVDDRCIGRLARSQVDPLRNTSFGVMPAFRFFPDKPTELGSALVFHGGPYSHINAGNPSAMDRILTSEGYSTLSVNYPGSTGYGYGFQYLLNQNADEVSTAALDASLKTFSDRQLNIVAGESYGAYLIALSLSQVPKHAVVVLVAGVYEPDNIGNRRGNELKFRRAFTDRKGQTLSPSTAELPDLTGRKFVVVHSDSDAKSRYEDAQHFVERLRSAGARVVFISVHGRTHEATLDEPNVLSQIRRAIHSFSRP